MLAIQLGKALNVLYRISFIMQNGGPIMASERSPDQTGDPKAMFHALMIPTVLFYVDFLMYIFILLYGENALPKVSLNCAIRYPFFLPHRYFEHSWSTPQIDPG